MTVRRAIEKDLKRVNELLFDVAEIHAGGRPDIFRKNTKKYEDCELLRIFENDKTPVFVAESDEGEVLGYAFCIYEEIKDNILLCDRKSLYIDDLCVDKNVRGKHVGKTLFDYVCEEAKRNDCYQVTLNVWNLNEPAMRFYEKCGMTPLKTVMEKII